MAIQDEIKREKSKMKDMSFKGKCKYIWDYYKIHIIVTIFVIILGSVLIKDIIEGSRPEYVNAEIVNTIFSYDDYVDIPADLAAYAQIDTKEYNISIDTSMLIDPSSTDQNTVMNMQKMMALFSANTMDVMIAPEEIIKLYEDMGSFRDITSVMNPEQIDAIEEKGYQVYDATYDGKVFPAGFYLNNSAYLKSLGKSGTYLDEQNPIFTFPIGKESYDNAIVFLEFLTQ